MSSNDEAPTIKEVEEAISTLESLLVTAVTWNSTMDLVEGRRVLMEPTVTVLVGMFAHSTHAFKCSKMVIRWLKIVGQRRNYIEDSKSEVDLTIFEEDVFQNAYKAALQELEDDKTYWDNYDDSDTEETNQHDTIGEEETKTKDSIATGHQKKSAKIEKDTVGNSGDDARGNKEPEEGSSKLKAKAGADKRMEGNSSGAAVVGGGTGEKGTDVVTGERGGMSGAPAVVGNTAQAVRANKEGRASEEGQMNEGRASERKEVVDGDTGPGKQMTTKGRLVGGGTKKDGSGSKDRGEQQEVGGAKKTQGVKKPDGAVSEEGRKSTSAPSNSGRTKPVTAVEPAIEEPVPQVNTDPWSSKPKEDARRGVSSEGMDVDELPYADKGKGRDMGSERDVAMSDGEADALGESEDEEEHARGKRAQSSGDDEESRAKRRKIQESSPKGGAQDDSSYHTEWYEPACDLCARTPDQICWKPAPVIGPGRQRRTCEPCREKKKGCSWSAKTQRKKRAGEGGQTSRDDDTDGVVVKAEDLGWDFNDGEGRSETRTETGPRVEVKKARAKSQSAERSAREVVERRELSERPTNRTLVHVAGGRTGQWLSREVEVPRPSNLAGEGAKKRGKETGLGKDSGLESGVDEEERVGWGTEGYDFDWERGNTSGGAGRRRSKETLLNATNHPVQVASNLPDSARPQRHLDDWRMQSGRGEGSGEEDARGSHQARGVHFQSGAFMTGTGPEGIGMRQQEDDEIRAAWEGDGSDFRTGSEISMMPAWRRVTPGGISEVTSMDVPRELNRFREDHVALESRVTELDSKVRVDRREAAEVAQKVGRLETAVKAITIAQTQDRGTYNEQVRAMEGRLGQESTGVRATQSFAEEVSKHLSLVESHHASQISQLDGRLKLVESGGEEASIVSQFKDLLTLQREEIRKDIVGAMDQVKELVKEQQKEQQKAISSLSSMVKTAIGGKTQGTARIRSSARDPPRPSQLAVRQFSAPPAALTRSYPENDIGGKERHPLTHSHSGTAIGGSFGAPFGKSMSVPPSGPQGSHQDAKLGNQGGFGQTGNTSGQQGGFGQTSNTSGQQGGFDSTMYTAPQLEGGSFGELPHPRYPQSHTSAGTYPPIQDMPMNMGSMPQPQLFHDSQLVGDDLFQNFVAHQGNIVQLPSSSSAPNVPAPSISQRSGSRSTRTPSQLVEEQGEAISFASTISRATNAAVFASPPPNPSSVTSYTSVASWSHPPSPLTEAPSSGIPSAARRT